MNIIVPFLAATGLLAAPLVPFVRPAAKRLSSICMRGEGLSEYEKYQRARGADSFKDAEDQYKTSITLRQNAESEFDGGDSGSGVVGDGNVDLEDQHNSATLGGNRGGIAGVGSASMAVGRGNVIAFDPEDNQPAAKGATTARTSSAGKNYFGRSTGLADKLISEITEEDLKTGKMDKVRAQQKENWFNQRAIHSMNRAQGQGVVFGAQGDIQPSQGGFVAREALSSDAMRQGAKDGEVSQRDLADHMTKLSALPAKRLDGKEWGPLMITANDPITETFEVRVGVRATSVTEIPVRNDFNTFAPFRCEFMPGSDVSFSVSPNVGSMNRRSGEPVQVTVRYKPEKPALVEGWLVFETEDMKKVYRFLGST